MSLKQELIGKEINGFRVTDCIGEGGMAYVFRAENSVDSQIVRALKIIRPEFMEKNLFFERFAREARVLESLTHPHIIRFHGLRRARNLLVMELEYLHGQTLIDPPFCQQPVPLEHVLIWMIQAASALSVAHDLKIVHRDIKPANLFLTNEGKIKILDFGIAKVLDSIEEERTGTLNGHVLGSPAYMAPEVCQGQTPTPQADVYALGLITYHLLMGRHPLIGPQMTQRTAMQMMLTHLHQTPPDLTQILTSPPNGLDRVLRRAVAQDPSERYPSAAHFARALQPFIHDQNQIKDLPLVGVESSLPRIAQDSLYITAEKLSPLKSKSTWKQFFIFSSILSLFFVGMFYQDIYQHFIQSTWIQKQIMSVEAYLNDDYKKSTQELDQEPSSNLIHWIRVHIPENQPYTSFMMSKTEITVAQYYQCILDKGCSLPPNKITVKYGYCMWQEMIKEQGYPRQKVQTFIPNQVNSSDQLTLSVQTPQINPSDDMSQSIMKSESLPTLLEHYQNKPMNCITHNEALTFAQWAQARLPARAEWQFAVRGSLNQASSSEIMNTFIYPWGRKAPSCRYAIMYDKSPACGSTKQPQSVCSKPFGMNADGICDLVGNLWEWSSDFEQEKVLILGGGWFSAAESMHSNAYSTRDVNLRDSSIGFRVITNDKDQ
jgi:serine/threonine protein kinase